MSELDKSKLEQLRQDIAAIGKQRPVHVLVVDDEQDSCLLIRDLLSLYSVKLDEAHSGKEALEALELVNYDVVLLDVKMPNMDGLTVHRAIKDSWPGVRVIFCTGFPEWPGLSVALEDGCVQIIGKNFLEKSLAEIFEPLCTKQT